MILLATLLLPAGLSFPPAPLGPGAEAEVAAEDAPAPPGFVLVPAGEIKLGTSQEEIEELITKNAKLTSAVVAEYAGKKGDRTMVDAFYLQPTELTNEQYAVFVAASEHRPPFHWGEEAAREAQQEHVREEGLRRKEARDRGETPPERVEFDPFEWWTKNWEGKPWAVPEGTETHPVVNVSYQDAEAYARWAGVRLPTEAEFMAAGGRGKDGQRYTWGDEWKPDTVVTSDEKPRREASAVASIPEGAARVGQAQIFDLLGNVWEWTSTPLTPFDGYDGGFDMEVTSSRKKKKKQRMVGRFDANERVTKGGGFVGDRIGSRLSTRQGYQRHMTVAALGFRCAADVEVGRTHAKAVVDSLPPNLRPEADLAPDQVMARDRWTMEAGSVQIENYSMITGYEYFVFVPVEELGERKIESLSKDTVEIGPVGIGVLSTSVSLSEPKLEPGDYLVSFRAAGLPRHAREVDAAPVAGDASDAPVARNQEADEAPPADPLMDLLSDPHLPHLVFYNEEGLPVGAAPMGEPLIEKNDELEAALRVEPWVAPEDEEEAAIAVPVDTIALGVTIPSARKKYSFSFPAALKVEPGTIDESWRE